MTPTAPALASALALALAGPLACAGGGGDTNTTTGATATATATDTASTTETGTGAGPGECGDGALNDGEVCDGALLGDKTCADLGAPYIGGELGCAATCAAFDASACARDPAAGIVRLNEILARGADEGPYAGMGDLIELVNVGGAAIDLSGWRLSDDPTLPPEKTYTFPPGSALVPGAFMVLVEYNDSVDVGDFPFGISSAKTETLTLADADVAIVEVLTFDGALADPSFCRLPDGGDEWATCVQTPGESNLGELPETCGDGELSPGEACDAGDLGGATCTSVGNFTGGALACSDACTFDVSGCTPALSLVLNELSSSDADLIELFNGGVASVDLSGWILTDDPSEPYDPDADPEAMLFAPGASLGPGGYLAIEKGANAGQHPFGLAASGDAIRLFDADLALVDAVSYGDMEAALSACRLPNGPGGAWTSDCVPTFGGPNQGP